MINDFSHCLACELYYAIDLQTNCCIIYYILSEVKKGVEIGRKFSGKSVLSGWLSIGQESSSNRMDRGNPVRAGYSSAIFFTVLLQGSLVCEHRNAYDNCSAPAKKSNVDTQIQVTVLYCTVPNLPTVSWLRMLQHTTNDVL